MFVEQPEPQQVMPATDSRHTTCLTAHRDGNVRDDHRSTLSNSFAIRDYPIC